MNRPCASKERRLLGQAHFQAIFVFVDELAYGTAMSMNMPVIPYST